MKRIQQCILYMVLALPCITRPGTEPGNGATFGNTDMLIINDCTFSNNGNHGASIFTCTSAQVNGAVATNNTVNGLNTAHLGKGNSSFNRVVANSNGLHGMNHDFASNMTMENITANANQQTGMQFLNSEGINIQNATVDSNYGNHGALFSNTDGLAAQIKSSNNTNAGIGLDTVTNFRLAQAVAYQNGGHGFSFLNSQFGYIQKSESISNGGNGFDLDSATANTAVKESTSNLNSGMGFSNNGGDSNVHNQNTAQNNGTNFSNVPNRIQQLEAGNKNVDENALAGITTLAPETLLITGPGVFTLTRTFSGQIIISASNVTLDLGGNIITGDNSQTSGTPPAGIVSVTTGLENITIQNGTLEIIDGVTAPLVGIDIQQSDEIVIQNIIINNSSTSASSIGIQGAGSGSNKYFVIDNVIISNPFVNTGCLGVAISSYDNITIRHYVTSQNGGTGLSINNSTNGTIENSTISNNGAGGVVSGIDLQFINQYVINNCNVSLNPANGISLLNAVGCTISNCSVLSNATNGILIGSGADCIIKNCNAARCPTGILINDSGVAGRSTGCILDSCSIASDTVSSGISLLNADKCKVQNCQTIGFLGQGILFTTVTDSIINDCSAVGFADGIQINESQNCTIKNCESSENTTGLLISGITSLNCQVKDCNSISNTSFGFQDTSDGSSSDHFIGNVAHTNATNYSANISPTTANQVTAGRYDNLSL